MNLYEEDEIEKSSAKSKKTVIILVSILGILLILCIAIIAYMSYIEKTQLKVYIDGKKVNVNNEEIIIGENNVYISIIDIASKINYNYFNGEYKHSHSEDKDKCYIDNGYETASYIAGSNIIYKSLKENSEDNNFEYYTIDEQVIESNNKLYTTMEGISKGCNSMVLYENPNTIKIYTLPYLYAAYSKQMNIATPEEPEQQEKYENQKAVLYGMIIVKNESKKYGVKDLENNIIIGQKYEEITFVEESQEFIVKTSDGKVGIITKDAITKVEPQYESIKQIDKSLGLYLVSKNSKYGIINEQGATIIYPEYDSIGIDKKQYMYDDINNIYILFNECIPVKKGDKWGMLDVHGKTILPLEYDDFGCKTNNTKNSLANPLLLIPEYKAFVVCKEKKYGLYDYKGKELIPIAVTDMYSIISSGKTYYYLTYEGERIDTIDYLINTLGINPLVNSNNINVQNNKNNEENVNTTNQNSGKNNETVSTSAGTASKQNTISSNNQNNTNPAGTTSQNTTSGTTTNR